MIEPEALADSFEFQVAFIMVDDDHREHELPDQAAGQNGHAHEPSIFTGVLAQRRGDHLSQERHRKGCRSPNTDDLY